MIEHKFPNTGGGGFPQKLVNLPDVSYTSLVTGQVPVYNSSTTKFDISTLNAGNIGSLEYQVTLWDVTDDSHDVSGGMTVPLSPSTQVPEPGTFILMVSGIAGLVALFRRSKLVNFG